MDKSSKAILGIIVALVVIWAGYALFKRSAPAGEETKKGSPAPVVQENKEPIKMGVILPLTGDAAAYGEPMRNIMELARTEINAAGGVNGSDLELIYEDGKCAGKDGTSAMQKLVNVDKVQVVLGGFCSGETIPAAKIANEKKVLLFSGGASSPDLTMAGPFFFRNYPSDTSQGQVLADVAFNKKNWKKAAIIQEQTDYALGFRKAFEEKYKALGGTVVLETFTTEAKDLRSSLTKLKGSNSDVLVISTQTPATAERVLKQLNDLNWKPSLIGIDVIPSSNIPKNNPELVEGLIGAEFTPDITTPKAKAFLDAYKAKYNKDLEYISYAMTIYDAVYMLKQAITEAGNDGTKVMEWLNKTKGWEGVSGIVEFDENGDRKAGHSPEVVKDGKVERLTF